MKKKLITITLPSGGKSSRLCTITGAAASIEALDRRINELTGRKAGISDDQYRVNTEFNKRITEMEAANKGLRSDLNVLEQSHMARSNLYNQLVDRIIRLEKAMPVENFTDKRPDYTPLSSKLRELQNLVQMLIRQADRDGV